MNPTTTSPTRNELGSRSHGTRVLRSAVGSLALNILTNGFLFVGNLLIARVLSRDDYAMFVVSVSFVTLFGVIADFGMTSLFTRLFAEAEERVAQGGEDTRGELLGTALALRILLACVAAVAILLMAPILGYNQTVVQQTMILVTTLFISSRLVVVRSVGESFLRGRGKYYLALAFSSLDAALFAGLMYYGSTHVLSLSAVVKIYAFNHIPGFLLLVGLIVMWLRREEIALSINLRRMKQLVWMAVPLGLGTAFLTLHNEADKLLMDKLSDYMQVSAFGASFRVMTAIVFFPVVVAAVAAPEITRLITRADWDKTRRLVDLSMRALLTMAGMIAIILTSTSDIVVRILGDKYVNVSDLVIVIGWLSLPIFFATFLLEVTIAAGRLRLLTLYGAVLAVVSIIMDFILLPSMGAMGGLISKGIAVTAASATLVIVERDQPYFDFGLFLKFVLRLLIAITLALAVREGSALIGLPKIVWAIDSTFIFFIAIHFTHAVRFSEVKSLLLRTKGGGTG